MLPDQEFDAIKAQMLKAEMESSGKSTRDLMEALEKGSATLEQQRQACVLIECQGLSLRKFMMKALLDIIAPAQEQSISRMGLFEADPKKVH